MLKLNFWIYIINFKHIQYKFDPMADFWKPTSDLFSGLIERPKMT